MILWRGSAVPFKEETTLAIKETDYLALTAMLAAREASMLNEDRMERMLAAPSVEEAAKIPEECGYGDLSGMRAEEVNAALEAHLVEIYRELAGIVPEPELVDIFRRKYDYHNLKVLLKAQHTGTSGNDLLSSRSSVPAEAVREALTSGEFQTLPPEIAHAAEEAQSILARTSNPQLADFALDRAYFAALTKLAEKVTDPFASEYVKLLIDNANLRAVVRTIRMGKDEDFLRLALVPGGEVSEPTLLAAAESPESFASAFQASRLAEAAEIGADAMQGGALTKFERQCDNTVLRYVKEAKRKSFCASHVVAYLAAMENEVTALRMILTGRLAGLSPDTIRERLRETYA